MNPDPRVIDLQAYRDMLADDHEDHCEAPMSRRARWINRAETSVLALLFVVAVVALCIAFTLSPVVALVLHFVRGGTP